MKVSGDQIRAARAFLKWTLARLAEEADVATSTVQLIEERPAIKGGGKLGTLKHREEIRAEALRKVVQAMERAGVTFLPDTAEGPGVRCKPRD